MSTAASFSATTSSHCPLGPRSSLTLLMPHPAILLCSPSPCQEMWASRPQDLFRAPTIASNSIPRRSCIVPSLFRPGGSFHAPSLLPSPSAPRFQSTSGILHGCGVVLSLRGHLYAVVCGLSLEELRKHCLCLPSLPFSKCCFGSLKLHLCCI